MCGLEGPCAPSPREGVRFVAVDADWAAGEGAAAHAPALSIAMITQMICAFFGGNLQLMGVGGAALNPEVEKFLYEARFPYLIGYGMTEGEIDFKLEGNDLPNGRTVASESGAADYVLAIG